jgi:serine/threonine-protein kinase
MTSPGGSAGAASAIDSRLLAGQLIGGRYRVSHLLGEGGMASVWAGSNERTGKLVALKVLRRSFMATPGADVFLRSEGMAASRVNHPNVVTVFDLIEHEGMACIVMELLDGVSLGTYVARNHPLTLRDAVGLLLPAMRGVAAAHAQGVIHRDLKPQNIFLCVDADGRVVTTKVLDFGISSMMDWARGQSVATMPMQLGTPSYMAPEHIHGAHGTDPRTDVYGFGLLLYEILAGSPAFPGSSNVNDVLERVLSTTPVPLRELRADLPMGIYVIVEKAMSKRPDLRFESLTQMMAVIEEEVNQLPMPAPGSGVPVALMNYTVSGPLSVGVPATVEREHSDQYATQSYGLPRREGEKSGLIPLVDEPSRKNYIPIKTPADGIASFRRRTTPIPPASPTATVPIPRGAFLRLFQEVWQNLREHRIYRIIAPPAAVLAMALVLWAVGRAPSSSRSGAVKPVPRPVLAPAVVEQAPPPSPPAPLEAAGPDAAPAEPPSFAPSLALPGENPSNPPSVWSVPPRRSSKSARGRSADSGIVENTGAEGRGSSAAETSTKTWTETNSQTTRRTGGLRVDDF